MATCLLAMTVGPQVSPGRALAPEPLLTHLLSLVQFEMGPPMSTYLLAVTVGRLEGVTQQSSSGMNVTVWAVPGLQGQLGVALQVRFILCAGGSGMGVGFEGQER